MNAFVRAPGIAARKAAFQVSGGGPPGPVIPLQISAAAESKAIPIKPLTRSPHVKLTQRVLTSWKQMLVGATNGQPLISWQSWVEMHQPGVETATDPGPPRLDPSCGSLLVEDGSQYFVEDPRVRMAMDGVAMTGGNGMCSWPMPQS
jgi:hypothetical protein